MEKASYRILAVKIFPAMAMAMSIYRTLCVLVGNATAIYLHLWVGVAVAISLHRLRNLGEGHRAHWHTGTLGRLEDWPSSKLTNLKMIRLPNPLGNFILSAFKCTHSMICRISLWHIFFISHLGKHPLSKTDEFLEKF